MKSKYLRVIIPLLAILAISIGFAFNMGTGTLSSYGWKEISLICPLGVLESMLASKTIFPRALISLVVIVVFVIFFGRAFCAWLCPVPLVKRLRNAFAKGVDPADEEAKAAAEEAAAAAAKEKAACAACGAHSKVDSRHFVLGGTLLSAAIFGFPVFCLICPVGLTFATILLVMNLFGFGDTTWGVVFAPVLLILEVVVFRKWCSKICPLSALLSLIAKLNKTFRPTVDHSKCLQSTKGVACSKCSQVCEVQINPRKPEEGASFSECTKCRACVENCPGHAITMPFLSKKGVAAKAGEGSDAS